MGKPATREELRELFGDGYDRLAAEAEERWGDTEAWRQSTERTATLSREQWADLRAQGQEITEDFAAALRLGVPPDDPQALNIAERHRRSLERFYDCPPDFHRDLADLYVGDRRFAAAFDAVEPGLAAYVRDAVHANAAWSQPATQPDTPNSRPAQPKSRSAQAKSRSAQAKSRSAQPKSRSAQPKSRSVQPDGDDR
jgi:hypothetical protein